MHQLTFQSNQTLKDSTAALPITIGILAGGLQAVSMYHEATALWLIPALTLWLYSIEKHPTTSITDYTKPGMWFGFSLYICSTYWLYYPLTQMIGILPALALIILCASFFIVAHKISCILWLYQKLQTQRHYKFISLAWLIVCVEQLLQYTFITTPWNHVGLSALHIFPFNQVISVFNISCLGYMIIHCANALKSIYQRRVEQISYYAIMSLILIATAYTFYTSPTKKMPPIKIGLIQPNITMADKYNPSNALHKYIDTLNKARRDHLILTPESLLRISVKNNKELNQLQHYFGDIDAILGITYQYEQQDTNHIGLLATGKATGLYHKQYRVPFGETIPGINSIYPIIQYLVPEAIKPLVKTMLIPKANENTTLQYKKTNIYPMLCYEVFFPAIDTLAMHKADMILISGENAWYSDSVLHTLMTNSAKFYAMHYQKPSVLILNRGPSTVFDAQGNTLIQTTFGEKSTTLYTLGIIKAQHPYHYSHDLAIIIALLALDWLCYTVSNWTCIYGRKLQPKKN